MANQPILAPTPESSDLLEQGGAPGLREFGQPLIRNVNIVGLKALYIKEVRRFLKVQLQTIWAPAVTTLLFLIIFSVALGRAGRLVHGVPFSDFVAPGLIIMGMLQNAFANSSFSLLVGKIQGTIIDYLMPPLSKAEVMWAITMAAVTRAFCVGAAVWLAMLIWPDVRVIPQHPWAVFYFGLMGAMMLAFLGLVTSVWAEKFDHAAMITNFVVAPLSLLSGTFYSIENLSPAFRTFSHFNPFFYAISGFRYGFIGVSDSPIWQGVVVLAGVNLVMMLVCYRLLKSGWKLQP